MSRWQKEQSWFDFVMLLAVFGIFAYVFWVRVQ